MLCPYSSVRIRLGIAFARTSKLRIQSTVQHRYFHHVYLALISIYVSVHFYVMTYVIL